MKIENIGKKLLGHQYLGDLNLFIDQDGTIYSVNIQQAQYHYVWKQGFHGIGYYRVD